MIFINTTLILILTVLTGALLPKTWNSIKKLVIALLLLFSLNTIVGYFLFLARLQINTLFFSYLYAVLILIVLYKLFINDRERLLTLYNWKRTDTAILLSVFLLFVVLIHPSVRLKGSNLNIGVPKGGDMSNHFFIANMVTQKGTYLYFDKKVDEVIPAGLNNYPQASHYNFAIFLSNHYESPVTLRYFRFYYLFCFLIFFALFLNASLDILSKKAKNNSAYAIVCSSALFIFVSTIFASTYLEGFLSQFIGLLVLIATVVIVIEQKAFENKLHWIVSIILLNALLAGVWYFISPIALTICCLAIYRSSYKKNILAYLVMFIFVLPPVIASFFSGALRQVAASGAVSVIPFEYYILFVGGTVFVFWQHKQTQFIALQRWTEVYLVSIIFCAAVGLTQLSTTGHVSYYFLKALYTPFLIMSLFYGIFVVSAISTVRDKLNNLPAVFSITTVFIILVGTYSLLIYRPELREVSLGLIRKGNYLSSIDFSQLTSIAVASKASNKSVILINTGSSLNDYVYSKWISAQNLDFTKSYGDQLLADLELADKFRRAGKSEELQVRDINLPNNSIQIIDFRTGSVLK